MSPFNVYLTGVGGQGIGLLSETILRAADHAGLTVKSVDTHGLAQRGGVVVSQIRMGAAVHSPLIPTGQADLVVSLERHEALRAAATMARQKGCLIYYNTVWQPLPVRLNQAREVSEKAIGKSCDQRGIHLVQVFAPHLSDSRMQNMVVLAEIARQAVIPAVHKRHYRAAMYDLMAGPMLEKNIAIFEKGVVAGAKGSTPAR